MRIRIVLADEHQLFRHSVRALLAHTADMEVVGEAGTGEALLQAVAGATVEVVCMNVANLGMDAAATIRKLLDANPRLGVIGLSEATEWPFVRDFVAAGGKGYLSKNAGPEELLLAIRTVARRDQRYFCQRVSAGITAAAFEKPGLLPVAPDLRGRDREIVRLIAGGLSTPEIALHLRLSPGTVRGYRSNIMRGLNLHSRTELTRYAIRNGISAGYAAAG